MMRFKYDDANLSHPLINMDDSALPKPCNSQPSQSLENTYRVLKIRKAAGSASVSQAVSPAVESKHARRPTVSFAGKSIMHKRIPSKNPAMVSDHKIGHSNLSSGSLALNDVIRPPQCLMQS